MNQYYTNVVTHASDFSGCAVVMMQPIQLGRTKNIKKNISERLSSLPFQYIKGEYMIPGQVVLSKFLKFIEKGQNTSTILVECKVITPAYKTDMPSLGVLFPDPEPSMVLMLHVLKEARLGAIY